MMFQTRLAQKFPIDNPATAGDLAGFICRRSGFIAKTFTFYRIDQICLLNSAIFKFNFTNARILLLYPYVVNIVGGTNRNGRIIILTSVMHL